MLQQRFFDNFIFFACGFLIKFYSFLYNFQFIFYFSLAFFYYKKILHLFHFFIVSHPHALDFCFCSLLFSGKSRPWQAPFRDSLGATSENVTAQNDLKGFRVQIPGPRT